MHRFSSALLLVVGGLISQGTLAQVRLGVKVGVNASNIHLDAATFDPLLGYQAGLMLDLGLSSHFSIQPALLVNAKGFNTELDIRDQNGQIQESPKGTYRLLYAEIPVLLTYQGALGKSWRWYGGVGPYAGIGLTGESEWNSTYIASSSVRFTSRKPRMFTGAEYKRMDYSPNAALGVERNRVQFGINYSHGLRSMQARGTEPNVAKTYNRTLALTAGYWFGK